MPRPMKNLPQGEGVSENAKLERQIFRRKLPLNSWTQNSIGEGTGIKD